MRGVWCQALSLPLLPVLWGGRPGSRDPCVPVAVGAGVGTQHRPHSVRPCGPALLAVGVAEGRPQGGCRLPLRGASEVRRSPSPELPAHWAGCWGPLPTCCGCGRVGLGAQHCPLALQALWGLRAAGVVGGRPRGGWPATVVRGVWCQALSLPLPPVLWGGQPGFCDPCVPGAVGAGVGTKHRPHCVRPCGPALLAVGLAEGRPRGGAFGGCEGRLRSGAPPPPTAHPLGRPLASATHLLWVRVCGCGGPTLSPWPACPVGAACRVGGGGPSPGGVACHCCGGVWCQALSLPRPPILWGGQPGFRDPCVPGAVGEGVGTQHLPHNACPCGPALRAVGVAVGRPRGASGVGRSASPGCPPSGRAAGARWPSAVGAGVGVCPTTHWLWGRHEGARGGRLLPGCGSSGDRRSPIPDLSSVRAGGQGPLPTGCGCGGCGRGDPSPTPQRALLRAGFARCGGGMRVSGGGRLSPGCGAFGDGRSPTPEISSVRACGRGPLPTGWGCGGCGREDPSPTPQRALLRAVGAA